MGALVDQLAAAGNFGLEAPFLFVADPTAMPVTAADEQQGADPAFVAEHRALSPQFYNDDGETFPIVVQTWIVRADGLNLVIDPCHGNDRNRPALRLLHKAREPTSYSYGQMGELGL